MPVVMSDDEFDGLVSDALDQVPAEFRTSWGCFRGWPPPHAPKTPAGSCPTPSPFAAIRSSACVTPARRWRMRWW